MWEPTPAAVVNAPWAPHNGSSHCLYSYSAVGGPWIRWQLEKKRWEIRHAAYQYLQSQYMLMEVAPRLMFRILWSILLPRPILCAPNQLKYTVYWADLWNKTLSPGSSPKAWLTCRFDTDQWGFTGRAKHGGTWQRNHNQIAQLHSGWLQIGWQLNSPGEREKWEKGLKQEVRVL